MKIYVFVFLLLSIFLLGCERKLESLVQEKLSSTIIDSSQQEWRRKTLAYAASINAFVEKGIQEGWENAGDEPKDPGRDHLVKAVLEAIRQSNATRDFSGLRERWPPAYSPFIDLIKENGQPIPIVYILPDQSIIARIGSLYENGWVVRLVDSLVKDVPEIEFFGRGPNYRYFAIARPQGVQIVDGWDGPETVMCPWPTGMGGVPGGYAVKLRETPPRPTQLIPFPDGERVLLVSSEGVFVLSPSGAKRLLPAKKEIQEDFEQMQNETLSIHLRMEHGAISKDGKWIAVGHQDSMHLIFDARLKLVGSIYSESAYPHYAVFSADNNMLALNSCHFYNGATIGVPTDFSSESVMQGDDERIFILEDDSRVYAAISRDDEFIIGDAVGYLRAFSMTGEPRWRHFIGSTINAMDISPDGKTLAVSTYGGFLSIIRLDVGKQAAYQIGDGHHLELRRWIFWKNEPAPLIW